MSSERALEHYSLHGSCTEKSRRWQNWPTKPVGQMQLSSWKGQVPPLKQGFRAQSTVNHRQRISILQCCVHDKRYQSSSRKKEIIFDFNNSYLQNPGAVTRSTNLKKAEKN